MYENVLRSIYIDVIVIYLVPQDQHLSLFYQLITPHPNHFVRYGLTLQSWTSSTKLVNMVKSFHFILTASSYFYIKPKWVYTEVNHIGKQLLCVMGSLLGVLEIWDIW